MTHGPAPSQYSDVVVFLAAAGVLVPLFNRFRISPVLGFLAAGVLLGPDGLGRFHDQHAWVDALTITDRGQISTLSELGVVFLMFTIGLELSWERLVAMRRMVFGLGVVQILACAAVIGLGFMAMGQSLAAAMVVGLALALSSTAVVMPVMAERGRLRTGAGRTAFSVLLAQDLAVAPILVMITVLAATHGGDVLNPAALGTGLLTLLPAVAGLAAIVLLGRLVLRPMFRSVARTRNAEMFLAACLLVVLGAGVLAQVSGLSMAIGALVAGILLAETEFRREVEVVIEPFKGLLLGVFFVSVGVGLDIDAVVAHPAEIIAVALGLTAAKAVIIFFAARAFRLSFPVALEAALVLGPAGEFAFVILTAAIGSGVVGREFAHGVLLSATLSLFLVPFLAAFAPRLNRTIKPGTDLPVAPEGAADTGTAPALIVGYGRVGRMVGDMLKEHGIDFIAVDSDPMLVAAARKEGQTVWYGDATRPDLLERLGLGACKALIITMDAPGKVDEVVKAVRGLRSDVILIARARDERHAAHLYNLGVTDAVPETTEASLQLAENVLVDLGVPMGLVLASIHQKREDFRKAFQDATPEGRTRPTRALRARTTVRP